MHNLGLVGHLQQQPLHAEEVDGVVPVRRPLAAEDGVLTLPAKGVVVDGRDIRPIGIRPRVCVDVVNGRVGERVGHGLAIAMAAAFDAEGRAHRGAGG